MKTLLIKTLALLFSVLLFQTCANDFFGTKIEGDRIQKEFELESFHTILLDMSAEVILTQGDKQVVTVTAQEGIFEYMEQAVVDGTWKIDLKDGSYNHEKVLVRITLPTIREIFNDASGDIIVSGHFSDLDELRLVVDGSGDIQFSGDANFTDIIIDASGDIELTGSSQKAKAYLDGSGSLSAFNFQIEDIEISTDASGDGKFSISRSMDVAITASGDIYYQGSPEISSQLNGTGKLIDAN